MNSKRLLLTAIFIWGIISFLVLSGDRTGTSIKPGYFPPVHPDIFFDGANFYGNEFLEQTLLENIKGGVIPHHLVAGKLIGRVFHQLKNEAPGTIILLGPNHQNLGSSVLTSLKGWQTPFGVVEIDEKLLQEISLNSPLLKEDDRVMAQEHAMGNIMPFIKYYLPKTKVVPIILQRNVTLEEGLALGQTLADLMPKDGVILASVDFSHYLTADEAVKKDQETIFALKNRDLSRIFAMGDDYLDSPPAMGVLFQAMTKMGMSDFTILNHTNSGVLLGNSKMETTSYITLLFGQEKKK